MPNLESYLTAFAKLHTSQSKGLKAPHKAVLLTTVINQIQNNVLRTNVVELTDRFVKAYREVWYDNVQINTSFICNPKMTFSNMGSEPFCTLNQKNQVVLDEDLFCFMRDKKAAEALKGILEDVYLKPLRNDHRVRFNEINPFSDTSLRPYQVKAKEEIYKMWCQKRSIMLQMPTGTGKTRLFVSIARDLFNWGAVHKMGVRILILAHRVELLNQINENVGVRYHLAHGQIRPNSPEEKAYQVQIGSVPTLNRRLEKWSDNDFDVIIIDEAHHVKAESYKRILKEYPRAKILGVTATPYRMSHEGFRPEFDDLIISAPVSEFIKQHYLCDYRYYSVRPDSKLVSDINSIDRLAMDGDFLDVALADVMDKDEIRAGIVSSYLRYARGKKGIVYTINRAHNEHVRDQFLDHGIKAVAIDSETPAEERARLVTSFKRGEIDIICNVNIFSEGFDCPDLEFIQLARPTKSLSMYLQQVGRGLRPAEGKEYVTIIDNVGLYNRFGFPSAKRKWRYHFEGRFVPEDEEVVINLGGDGSHEVTFFDDYDFSEGDELVEMLHASNDEVVVVNELPQEDPNVNEPEYRFFLRRNGISEEDTDKVVRYIKKDIDGIIRDKYNSKHTSILARNDRKMLELYLQDFRFDAAMSDFNNARSNAFIEVFDSYIKYLRWVEKDRAENIVFDNLLSNFLNLTPARTIDDVLTEIELFRKHGHQVPETLLKEYESFSKELHRDE